MSGYSQFIYGKFYNHNSGYCLVACTPDLEKYQEQLRNIAEKEFRFWGAKPPEGNKKAVGIFQLKNEIGTFLPQDSLVLTQTEEASQASGGSPYTQQRYIFVPKKDVINEPILLTKLWNIRIPIFPNIFEPNLEYFKPESLERPKTKDLKDEKLQEIISCLEDKKDGEQSLILSALSALLKKQKLILTIDGEQTIIPQKFVENILLMLPASCPNLLAVAMGSIDETRCVWADLIMKIHGFPNYQKLPKDIIWLNRKIKKFLPQVSSDILEHPYVQDFLINIDKNPDSIRRMLEHLQTLTDDEFTLDSLSKADTLAHIIPGLTTGEKQVKIWHKYIPKISNIKTLLEKNIDKESLYCLWEALEKLGAGHEDAMLVFIEKLKEEKLDDLLIEILKTRLISNLDLAEKLILQLFELLNIENSDISDSLKQLCQKIVEHQSNTQQFQIASDFAFKLIEQQKIYSSYDERLTILDAILFRENVPKNVLKNWFSNLAYLLASVESETIYESNFYKKHLGKDFPQVQNRLQLLLNNRRDNLVYLLHIADEMEMNTQDADKMFVYFLKTCLGIINEKIFQFLFLLIPKSIDIHNKSQKIYLQTDRYPETFSWFKTNYKEQINNKLNQLEQSQTHWNDWYDLASIFYTDECKRVTYLDKNIQLFPHFPVEMLTAWMSLIETQRETKTNFINSNSYSNLNEETITNFINREQKHMVNLSFILAEYKKLKLISGTLLTSLCQSWLDKKNIPPTESDLWNALVSANDKSFKSNDNLQLIRVSWYLKQQTVISLNQVNLDDVDKKTVYDDAFKIIKDCKHWEKGQNIIDDCYALKLDKSNIQNLVSCLISEVNPQPDKIVNLLKHATNKWQLGVPERKKIIQDIAWTQKDNHLLQYYVQIEDCTTN